MCHCGTIQLIIIYVGSASKSIIYHRHNCGESRAFLLHSGAPLNGIIICHEPPSSIYSPHRLRYSRKRPSVSPDRLFKRSIIRPSTRLTLNGQLIYYKSKGGCSVLLSHVSPQTKSAFGITCSSYSCIKAQYMGVDRYLLDIII